MLLKKRKTKAEYKVSNGQVQEPHRTDGLHPEARYPYYQSISYDPHNEGDTVTGDGQNFGDLECLLPICFIHGASSGWSRIK